MLVMCCGSGIFEFYEILVINVICTVDKYDFLKK